MHRREFLIATGASLSLLLANNRLALAKIQSSATPASSDEDKKPVFSIDEQTLPEAMYLGALFTWLELLEDTIDALYLGIDAVDAEPDSDTAKTSMLMPLGVWAHLTTDTQKISAPPAFEVVHDHTTNVFVHLGSAANIISTGVVSGNSMAITLGTEHINLATDSVGELIEALPFARPQRADIFD